jgi:hypothetical protein
VEIEHHAKYDRDNAVLDPLNTNNPTQAIELREMHDTELRHHA